MFPRLIALIGFVALIGFGVDGARSQPYPNKPIRIVAPGIGGSGDFTARLIASGLAGSFAQQVVVDNRGNGIVRMELVVKAQPDGYTLLLSGATVWLLPFMQDKMSYDPVKDLAPVTLAGSTPNILIVNPSVAAKSVKELIVFAKSKPKELNYAISGLATSGHLAGELFKSMAGVDIVQINYKSAGAALTDVIAGQVQLTFATAASVTQHMKSGRLRALAVTSAQPSALFPNLPTVAASGLPGYESVSVSAVFAPAGTPRSVITRLNAAIVDAISRAEVKEKFLLSGAEVVASSSEQLAATMKSDMAKLGKVIKDAGIREE